MQLTSDPLLWRGSIGDACTLANCYKKTQHPLLHTLCCPGDQKLPKGAGALALACRAGLPVGQATLLDTLHCVTSCPVAWHKCACSVHAAPARNVAVTAPLSFLKALQCAAGILRRAVWGPRRHSSGRSAHSEQLPSGGLE